MIITKSGRRMFPTLRLRFNGNLGCQVALRHCDWVTVEKIQRLGPPTPAGQGICGFDGGWF